MNGLTMFCHHKKPVVTFCHISKVSCVYFTATFVCVLETEVFQSHQLFKCSVVFTYVTVRYTVFD